MDIQSFSVPDLEDYLLDKEIPAEVATSFSRNCVCGKSFTELTEGDLRDLCPLVGVRTKIRALIAEVS